MTPRLRSVTALHESVESCKSIFVPWTWMLGIAGIIITAGLGITAKACFVVADNKHDHEAFTIEDTNMRRELDNLDTLVAIYRRVESETHLIREKVCPATVRERP